MNYGFAVRSKQSFKNIERFDFDYKSSYVHNQRKFDLWWNLGVRATCLKFTG